MKHRYQRIAFKPHNLKLVLFIDTLCKTYRQQGFMLSVRQLYYQLVSENMVVNEEKSYKRVASLINDGRLAGLIDWDAIEDRNRDIELHYRWSSGQEIIRNSANGFKMDMWENQDNRVFVIVEKAALSGVLGGVCNRMDVPLLAARGYPSVSVVRDLVQTHILPAMHNGQYPTIIHMGDHDPSGIDMTRDLADRIKLFCEDNYDFQPVVDRIALTMDQITKHKPPPNPAKQTDSRFLDYARHFGEMSWELDALKPQELVRLATDKINDYIDEDAWKERSDVVEEIRAKLVKVADDFDKIKPGRKKAPPKEEL